MTTTFDFSVTVNNITNVVVYPSGLSGLIQYGSEPQSSSISLQAPGSLGNDNVVYQSLTETFTSSGLGFSALGTNHNFHYNAQNQVTSGL